MKGNWIEINSISMSFPSVLTLCLGFNSSQSRNGFILWDIFKQNVLYQPLTF